jgi:superfamily II DNA or RNA helicase
VLSTAKALDEGFDIEGIELGIIASYTSSSRQNIQRTGRAIRYLRGKFAVVVNLYIKDTQEKTWLKRALDDELAVYVDSVDDINRLTVPSFL